MQRVVEGKVPMGAAMGLRVGRDKATNLNVGSCRRKLSVIVRGKKGKGLAVGRKTKGGWVHGLLSVQAGHAHCQAISAGLDNWALNWQKGLMFGP